MAIEMPVAQFEELVAEALDTIPPELAALMDNCVVLVEDDPQIFRRPILAICDTEDDVVEEVRITVVHEIAHHFGIDDDRLDELGYG